MKRSTIFKSTSFPKNFISFSFLLFCFLTVIVLSCKNDDSNNAAPVAGGGGGGNPQIQTFYPASKWAYYKLDRATIEACLPLFRKKNKSVILEFYFLGVKVDGRVVMKLSGTPSKQHNSGVGNTHGRGTRFCFMLDTIKYKPLEDTVMLGNNYLDWKVIGDAIFTDATHRTLKANFGYILLEPMNTYNSTAHPGRTMVKGHLWYKLTYYDPEGNLWDPQPAGGGGVGSSNPSPPADPTP